MYIGSHRIYSINRRCRNDCANISKSYRTQFLKSDLYRALEPESRILSSKWFSGIFSGDSHAELQLYDMTHPIHRRCGPSWHEGPSWDEGPDYVGIYLNFLLPKITYKFGIRKRDHDSGSDAGVAFQKNCGPYLAACPVEVLLLLRALGARSWHG